MSTTETPSTAGALEADEIRRLARMAAEIHGVVDLVVEGAEMHGEAAIGQPVSRPVLAAMLSRDLRRAIDMSPAGWALLVAELALRAVEQRPRARPR